MLATTAIAGTVDAAARPPMPGVSLGSEMKGAAAVQALGRDLPAVAAHYRMSPERLQEILTRDGSARLDRGGRLFFVEQPASTAPSTPPIAQTYVTDLTQTFLLNSKPGASKVLYLDFDGYSTPGSAWNGGAAITAQPYDTDGIPGSFSDAEKTAITNIWRRVAEDYATFDINVTTQDPGAAAIQRTSVSDQNFGTRVVITRNSFYNCSCGGVAYVGTYDYYSSSNPDYYQPAWVFFNALGNGNEKYVAEAASHEAGHNLGLSHDGRSNPVESYYSGHGSGETGWAPIMGSGYGKNLTQWSKGEYPYADNQEDDFVVIGQNGLLPRADEAGDSLATAATLSGTSVNGSFNALTYGLINTAADVDVYAFVAGAGAASFQLSVAPLGPNDDLRADILDAGGNVLASANPVDLLSASVAANLAAGTYYLRVEGVGKGDLSTGYSDYGSVGQYKITGSFTDSGAVAPVADFTATPTTGTIPLQVSFNAGASSDADGSIVSYAWNFGDGSTGTGITASRTYSSAGSFTVTLTVTDSTGLSASSTAVITANAPPASAMSVSGVSVLASSTKSGYRCTASVAVQNNATLGAVPGASVSGTWSGTVTGSVAGTTGSNGVATITSGNTKKRGTCTYTVNGVTAAGYVYANPATKPSGSVTY